LTSRELSLTARPGLRGGVGALDAQRLIDFLTLRLAPSAVAGLIAYSHLGEIGEGVLVLVCMLVATHAIENQDLPLHLMPASRVMIGIAAPVVGSVAAWLVSIGVGESYSIMQFQAVILGGWLALALGAWIRTRLGTNLRARIAVIGSRDFAADFAAELTAADIDKYEVVGWVGGQGPADYRRLRYLGTLDNVRAGVIAEGVDLLVCAPPETGGSVETVCAQVADECLDLPVRLIAANQMYEEVFGHVPVGTIDSAWYRYIMHPKFRASAPFSKRLFDLFFGTLIALFFLPFVAIAAIAIKLGDGGPVLYRQRRLGEFGHEFEILKLRTMRVDAERHGPQWAAVGDDRITRTGRVLRRTHLDEVPQLWNVLRGEMTLVGPRPERPEMVAELERKVSHYTRRHLVKPGIAGWAALRCGYAGSDLGTAWKLCHDLFYIKRRSVLADTLILAETVVEVFRDAHRALRAPGERFLVGERTHG
jgi:exopolysaccharide biosynthesis polyprenyl glycosylphosphotransferase